MQPLVHTHNIHCTIFLLLAQCVFYNDSENQKFEFCLHIQAVLCEDVRIKLDFLCPEVCRYKFIKKKTKCAVCLQYLNIFFMHVSINYFINQVASAAKYTSIYQGVNPYRICQDYCDNPQNMEIFFTKIKGICGHTL